MVFEILGPSLEDLFNYCGRIFSLKTVLMLADQIITRLQHIHSKNIIHQDIKPENFLMGIGEKGKCVYVTDLGLAAEFLPHDAPPAASESHFGLLGTANFASVNGHHGISKRTKSCPLIVKLADHFPEQSQRDDMESLGYMMLYFLNGRLPWHGLRTDSKQQKYQLIMNQKASTSLDDLCVDVPNEFKKYMDCVRALGFGGKPDYSRLRRMFRDLFVCCGFEYDYVFDWTILKYMESLQQQSQEVGSGPETTTSIGRSTPARNKFPTA